VPQSAVDELEKLPDAAVPTTGALPFSGGTMVFYEDRVELCGMVIFQGGPSTGGRRALNLLCVTRHDGSFAAYSGKDLAKQADLENETAANGIISHLRKRICEVLLKEANIKCGREEVILSRDKGYRLSQKITVQFGDKKSASLDRDIEDTGFEDDVPKDVPNVPNDVHKDHVPNALNASVTSEPFDTTDDGIDDELPLRREWLLKELREGRQIDRRETKHRPVARQRGGSRRPAKSGKKV
jgi:hypothetical protein